MIFIFFVIYYLVYFRYRYPVNPETVLPNRTPSMADCKKILDLSYAKFAINIDMVKPIPARNETPIKCLKLTPSGNPDNPVLIDNNDISKIPRKLPTIKAKAIVSEYLKSKSVPILIPALAKAKTGMIKYATQLCNLCSRC